MKHQAVQRMSITGLLIAIGIVIPMFSPVRVVMEPASFTLASHVAIMIAMMISPMTAVMVAVGTTIGFFIGGFPIVIVFRAATHVIFAALGAAYLQRRPQTLHSTPKIHLFSLLTGVVHALCEVCVVIPFYFDGSMSGDYYQRGFVYSVVLLVGLGTVIHSMVDFEISLVIYRALNRVPGFEKTAAR